MPRVLPVKSCPHCGAEVPQPTPRTCPACVGSLQKRYLTAGCLSSAPPLILFALALGSLLGAGSDRAGSPASAELGADAARAGTVGAEPGGRATLRAQPDVEPADASRRSLHNPR